MAEIALGKGFVVVVDDADYEFLSQFNWQLSRISEDIVYARANISMHRLLSGLKPGDKRVVDHKDGNGLNNTRSNLRIATVAENSKNRRPRKSSKSPYKGVKFAKVKWGVLKKPWQAQIYTNGKNKHLGYFATAEEAAEAYNAAARKYFGEFAYLNKVKMIG